MEHLEKWLILAIFIGFATVEAARTGFFHKARQTRSDGIVELVSIRPLWIPVPKLRFLPAI